MLDFDEIIIFIGFVSATIINAWLIYMTVFHVTYIKGTYKYMMIIFACFCVFFNAIEFLSRPHLHNFNGSLTYLSYNVIPENEIFFHVLFIDLYAGLYCSLIAFVAVQFIFRYATLLGHRNLLESFHGPMKAVWLPAVITPGILFCFAGLILMEPDEYSDDYINEEIKKVYSRDVKKMARLILVAYDEHKNIRWKNLSYCFIGSSILSIIYSVIIFCGLKMKLNIIEQLKNLSARHRNLEIQFFKTILIQIILPTVFLTFPMIPMLVLPIFDLKISFHSDIFHWALSFYPSLDSIAVMMVISEYRICIKKILKCKSNNDVSNQVSSLNTPQ